MERWLNTRKMKFILTSEGQKDAANYMESSLDIEHSVYEVVRIIDGVALFLEDHFQRFVTSAKLQEIDFQLSFAAFKQRIAELVSVNGQTEGNVKFVCFAEKNQSRWVAGLIPHSYPSADDYKNGVATDLLFAERDNPNAKVIKKDLRLLANKAIAEKSVYEVLLANQQGKITEGSRSNVFFCKSDELYTAPASLVLEGITRQKVIQCIKKLGINLIEKSISVDELHQIDAAFITGTSPKVLPIRAVGNLQFDVQNKIIIGLMSEYNRMIDDYLAKEKA